MPLASRLRPSAGQIFALAGAATCAEWLCLVAFSTHYSGDYNLKDPVGGNNAAPGIAALLHGSLTGYLEHQPIIGLTSILLRLPVVAIASHLGAGNLLTYKLGALACMLPLALLAGWMLAEPSLSPRQRTFRLLAVLVVVQSPILRNAVESGHPEGVLAKALDVAAVIVAMQGRARLAAVLLGLAIATKESAVIAVPPVVIALPGRRRELGLIAGGVVLVLLCAGWAAEPPAFLRALHGEGHTKFLTPLSLLWPLGSPEPLADGHLSLARVIPWGLTRTGATLVTLAAAAIPAGWWYARSRRRGASCHPLALLALLGVLRCFCDSTHEMYYYVSVLIALGAWEAVENRLPVATLLVSVSVSWVFSGMGRIPAYDVYLLCTSGELLLIVYLARHAMAYVPPAIEISQRASSALSGAVPSLYAGAPGRPGFESNT